MLNVHIIDAIEQEERRRREQADVGRARLELPVPEADWRERPREEISDLDEEADRGILIIPLR